MSEMEIRLTIAQAEQVATLLEAFGIVLRDDFPDRLLSLVAEYDDPWELLGRLREEDPADSHWLADQVAAALDGVLDEIERPVPAPAFAERPSDEWADAFALLQAAAQGGAGSKTASTLVTQLMAEHDHGGLVTVLAALGSSGWKLAAGMIPGQSAADLLAQHRENLQPTMEASDRDTSERDDDDRS